MSFNPELVYATEILEWLDKQYFARLEKMQGMTEENIAYIKTVTLREVWNMLRERLKRRPVIPMTPEEQLQFEEETKRRVEKILREANINEDVARGLSSAIVNVVKSTLDKSTRTKEVQVSDKDLEGLK